MQAADLALDESEEFGDLFVSPDVARFAPDPPSRSHFPDGALDVCLTAGADNDLHAGFEKPFCDAAADPPGCSGDQRHLSRYLRHRNLLLVVFEPRANKLEPPARGLGPR